MQAFHKAARGELENFVLVVEGSILNEKLTGGGYWAAMGSDPKTGQPITTSSIAGLLAGTEVPFAFACKELRVKETELV
jgi:hydrogenase small subunit